MQHTHTQTYTHTQTHTHTHTQTHTQTYTHTQTDIDTHTYTDTNLDVAVWAKARNKDFVLKLCRAELDPRLPTMDAHFWFFREVNREQHLSVAAEAHVANTNVVCARDHRQCLQGLRIPYVN